MFKWAHGAVVWGLSALATSIAIAQPLDATRMAPGRQPHGATATTVAHANQQPVSPLTGQSIYGPDILPRREGGRLVLPPLRALTTDLSVIGTGVTPEDYAAATATETQPLPEGPERQGQWAYVSKYWQATNSFSHPLYFEDIMLERHGHQRFPLLQPFVSGARFFGTFPALPYLMTVDPPMEFDYTLGYFRVGSPAPPLLQRPPFDQEAAVTEAAAVGAGIWLIP